MDTPIRLGVNIDHVATIRNARGGDHPDPVRAARLAIDAGADGITAHLREDRRHISDRDIAALLVACTVPVNLEMAPTAEMLEIALRFRPHAVCLVPERREERTTEGGLDVTAAHDVLRPYVADLRAAGILVTLFIEPTTEQVAASARLGAHAVEFHTGRYCHAVVGPARDAELSRLKAAAQYGRSLGLECHAGHGLSYETVEAVAAIPEVVELNIGHFLIGEAVFIGLAESVARMRALMQAARAAASPPR
jgi:pyridoxine 5-phosphate synthase